MNDGSSEETTRSQKLSDKKLVNRLQKFRQIFDEIDFKIHDPLRIELYNLFRIIAVGMQEQLR